MTDEPVTYGYWIESNGNIITVDDDHSKLVIARYGNDWVQGTDIPWTPGYNAGLIRIRLAKGALLSVGVMYKKSKLTKESLSSLDKLIREIGAEEHYFSNRDMPVRYHPLTSFRATRAFIHKLRVDLSEKFTLRDS